MFRIIHLVLLNTYKGRNLTNAHNAIMLVHKQALLEITKTHSLEKPNQCKWCDFSSITRFNLNRHILTQSGEKPHHYNECGSSFSQAQHLKSQLRIHTGEKLHQCTKCSFSSAQSSNLKQHMIRHSTTVD